MSQVMTPFFNALSELQSQGLIPEFEEIRMWSDGGLRNYGMNEGLCGTIVSWNVCYKEKLLHNSAHLDRLISFLGSISMKPEIKHPNGFFSSILMHRGVVNDEEARLVKEEELLPAIERSDPGCDQLEITLRHLPRPSPQRTFGHVSRTVYPRRMCGH